MPHWVYYFNFSILLYNSWRLISGSGKHLIKIRGHRSQDKLRSSICLLFSAFFSGMILSNVFFLFSHILPLLSVSIFYSNSDFSSECSLFRSWFSSALRFVTSVFTFFKNKNFKVYCKSLFNISNLKTFQKLFFHFSSFKLKSPSTRLIEWQERIANKRTITPIKLLFKFRFWWTIIVMIIMQQFARTKVVFQVILYRPLYF